MSAIDIPHFNYIDVEEILFVYYIPLDRRVANMLHFELRSKLPFNICVMIEVVDLLCQDHEIKLHSASPSS